jgi:ABC-type lipoprotein release transport system permease subunit
MIRKFLDNYYKNQGPGLWVELGMQRFDEQYLHAHFKNGVISGGRIEYVRLFSMVALFILLIACINFMNLTTARSVKRAKEIGVRKVMGGRRGALIGQFISEAMLLAFFAFIIALVLVNLLLPGFNMLTGKNIVFPATDPLFWLQLIALGIITGIISGSYPALFLSSFQPVKVLKGTIHFSKSAAGFRKGLVIFQFVLSILLIIGTIIVSRQVNYIQTKNLGYNRENLVFIPLEGDLPKQYTLFKQELLKQPGIKLVTQMTGSPVAIGNYQDAVDWEGKAPDYRPTFAIATVGYDFTKTMGVQLLEGRDFSINFPTDATGFVINEAAAKKMGYAHPIGKRVTLEDGRSGLIIGMIRDFHTASLHEAIDPMILSFGEKGWGNILVRTTAGKTQQALTALERLCKELNPKFPFSYQFSDEEYLRLYKSEQVIRKLGSYFAFLAILISCLGLLGLALFTAEQRTKEIGIRKVLGASVTQLFILLSGEFLLLVLIAFVIAGPLAWWAMSKWLEGYAYRTVISWWIFIVAGTLALLIALITVSSQTIKTALANPAKSLRTE